MQGPCNTVQRKWNCQLELWQVMEPLVSFTEKEVLVAVVPSNWVELSSPSLAEPTPAEPTAVAAVVTAAIHEPTQRDPYWQPMVEIDLLPPREETSLLLHPRWCHSSQNISSYALCPGLWKLWEACRENPVCRKLSVSVQKKLKSCQVVGFSKMAT